MQETEFLIIGAGIVGLTIAKELIAKGADKIIIMEKEATLGMHASGRNSGVLHAGIYYPPETLKAKLCLKGNLLMQEYCRENNLSLIKTGKVIVARNEQELPILQNLFHRSQQNGAKVEMIDEQQLSKIEPNAKTYQQALYSHYTAVVDNKQILHALEQELLRSQKVTFAFNHQFKGLKSEFIANTSQQPIKFKRFINAAGAHADTVAHSFDVGREYCLIPFKGIYQKLVKEQAHLVNGNIYPVPNLGNPFLGVHFTKNIQGDVYVGPTAIPAFGRENYGILKGIDRECFKIAFNEMKLFFTNSGFRSVALQEPKKYLGNYFYNDAKQLVKHLQRDWLTRATKVGIRPQLVNLKQKTLMMDFLIVNENHSLAFAKYVMEDYD